MLKSTIKVAMLTVISAVSLPSIAQENLLAEKPIYTLGEAKTWTLGENSYSFNVSDLAKLVAVPTNTANVYLFPEEAGPWNTPENLEIGIQGFYVDMTKSQEVRTVITTWEGAAANALNIYVTDAVPTLDILNSEPTYSATGLGQYQEKTFLLPEGTKGRYLVLQPTDATNYAWGVKIRSIAATAPSESVLTSFSVSPSFVVAGATTPVTYTIKDQLGLDMTADVSVEGGSLDGDILTIDGDYATFTATAGDVTMQSVVYAVRAPQVPEVTAIKTPIYTNAVTEYNGTSGFIVAYNGGAKELGRLSWPNGEVAAAFGDTKCVFFYNNSGEIMGGWDIDINPTEKGYGSLHLDVFATRDVTGNVEFERTVTIGDKFQITLEAGKWNSVNVPLMGETLIHTMSIRFNEENASDIVLSNIYFAPLLADGDEEAPVLGEVTVDPKMSGATFTLTATDRSQYVYYSIQIGDNHYVCNGLAGSEVTYTVTGLSADTDYVAYITVGDGVNVSEPKEVTFRTLSLPAPPVPTHAAEKVRAIFSPYYGVAALPVFDNWGSAAWAAPLEIGDETVLSLNNYQGQWGGLVNFEIDAAALHAEYVHIDVLGSATDGKLVVYPVWTGKEGTHVEVDVKADRWNSYDFALADDFAYTDGNIFQFAMTNSTIPGFAVDNFYFYSNNDLTSISDVTAESAVANKVFDLQGRLVAEGEAAAHNLPAGLYIVGGRKVIKK